MEQNKIDRMEIEVRQRRTMLLAKTDWTQLSDASADKSAWAVYRQDLRDVPNQEGFPEDISWPNQPTN
jgi:hypothetical protein